MTLYLTFDDGPDPQFTPRVLERLAANRARAPFFVLGEQVRAHPELVREMVGAGHRVELHGDEHLDHRTTPDATLAIDTARAIHALEDVGVVPQWWRLPWGRPGPATAPIAAAHGLRVAGWDADTHDWRGDGWRAQSARVREVAAEGGVVLLHDGLGPGAQRRHIANTLELIDRLLELPSDDAMPLPLPDASSLGARDVPASYPDPHADDPQAAAQTEN